MNNFNFCVPTDIRFGKGQIEGLPAELTKYGKKILLCLWRRQYKENRLIR